MGRVVSYSTMNSSLILIALCAIALSTAVPLTMDTPSATRSESDYQFFFQKFAEQHGKRYATSELSRRYSIFKDKLEQD